jgi:UDP-3-O-acyl-N-acetylglucosamine deacetylase
VRFHNDEPARHQLVQLIGALALLGQGGNSGLPLGHIVSLDADAALTLEFVRALYETCRWALF